MTKRLVLVVHSSAIRATSEREILETLSPDEAALPRMIVLIDTTPFVDEIESGDWSRSAEYLREKAQEIRRVAMDEGAELRYFGVAEVPHIIALGAYLGDEYVVKATDFDRDSNEWKWRSADATGAFQTLKAPRDVVTRSGDAVIRVSISSVVQDTDVVDVVGTEMLAEVEVAPTEDTPMVTLVRSWDDVVAVRTAFRQAYAAVLAARPNLDSVHLFIAAPASVCLAIGQELRLRNSPPVVTYRFRREDGEPTYKQAITVGTATPTTAPLTPDEIATLAPARDAWTRALDEVKRFAASLTPSSTGWLATLFPDTLAHTHNCPPSLPCLAGVVDQRDTFDPLAFDQDLYKRDKDSHRWLASERLLAGLHASAPDATGVQSQIRLFLFHEYVHEHNGLTAYTSAEVGRYPNCLEHVDYFADVYALLHELAFRRALDPMLDRITVLNELIDQMLQAFWAFDPPAPRNEWSVRRLRRYLNWHWRGVQLRRTDSFEQAVEILLKKPVIEIDGPRLKLRGHRVLVDLSREIADRLSLCIVLENERMKQIGETTVINLRALLEAFRLGHHRPVVDLFNAIFDDISPEAGALPQRH